MFISAGFEKSVRRCVHQRRDQVKSEQLGGREFLFAAQGPSLLQGWTVFWTGVHKQVGARYTFDGCESVLICFRAL